MMIIIRQVLNKWIEQSEFQSVFGVCYPSRSNSERGFTFWHVRTAFEISTDHNKVHSERELQFLANLSYIFAIRTSPRPFLKLILVVEA